MNPNDNWQSFVAEKTAFVQNYWLTREEFKLVLDEILSHGESPINGLQFTLKGEYPFIFDPICCGNPLTGDDDRHSVVFSDTKACQVRWQLKQNCLSATNIRHELFFKLFNAWWKAELRTPSAGLPDLKRNTIGQEIAEATLAYHCKRGHSPAILFCDLDDFGQVNKKYSQGEGDRVIKEFGSCVESTTSQFGIILHNGGDEMVVFCPKNGASAAISAAFAVYQGFSIHDFGIAGLDLGMSAGLASLEVSPKLMTFKELLEEADHALHNCAKKPKKGRARFSLNEEYSGLDEWQTSDVVALAKCLVISAASNPSPFDNAWLNSLSGVIRASALNDNVDEIAEIARKFIHWMDGEKCVFPLQKGYPPAFQPTSVSVSAIVTPIALAFAIAHGVILSPIGVQGICIKYTTYGNAAEVALSNGDLLWSSDTNATFTDTEICQLHLTPPINDGGQTIEVVPRAVLIKIGLLPLPIPSSLFSEIIVVDDRPTRSGCLPDFWEVTIGRLVSRLHSDPNILDLFVMGDEVHGTETVRRLRDLSEWRSHAENLASRLAVTTDMIRQSAKRLEKHVHFPRDWQSLARILASTLNNAPPFQPIQPANIHPRRLLERPLSMEDLSLHKLDGCHVETIAQAFPVVLEIVRKADISAIDDQAGRSVKELSDFKVHLSKPQQDKIPDYYINQKERMDEYFKGAFLDKDRFFGNALQAGGQLDAVLSHVAKIIQLNERSFATRRAILIVPHEIKENEDLSPLGLVSVRLIPRFYRQRCEISYSFTWRTVEALIGFPYSLYGSVCFGEELTRQLSSMIEGG